MGLLPQEVYNKWPTISYIKQKKYDEYSSSCPNCNVEGHDWSGGDPDRFIIRLDGNARGFCRKCGYFSFVNSTQGLKADDWNKIIKEKEEQQKLKEIEVQESIRRLQESAYWQGYHDGMSTAAREIWQAEGIPDSIQDFLMLGYVGDKSFYTQEGEHHSPALVIPYLREDKPINVQYRLLSPPKPNDRYRFTPKLPVNWYYTMPIDTIRGKVLIVEGAKKAIVLFKTLQAEPRTRLDLDFIIASPSKNIPKFVNELKDSELIWLGLDPDVTQVELNKAVECLGTERVRVISWPFKPDDMINKYKANHRDMWNFIKASKPASL